MSLLPAPTQEIANTPDKFLHRLVSADGKRQTKWATYSEYAYMDGYVGVTAYCAAKEEVWPASTFLTETAITE